MNNKSAKTNVNNLKKASKRIAECFYILLFLKLWGYFKLCKNLSKMLVEKRGRNERERRNDFKVIHQFPYSGSATVAL